MADPSREDPDPPIGGFLGIELPAGDGGGFRRHWKWPEMDKAYANARSALKVLIDAVPRGSVWLPAYLCPELGAVVPPARRRFYAVDDALSPVVPDLRRAVADNDVVLAVNYFGRPPGAEFLGYVAANPGVWFVEDCAQAMETGQASWGDWQLYSPRKLLGVPDGGVLAARSARAAEVPLADSAPARFTEAVELARAQWSCFEDIGGRHNEDWYALHHAKEAGLGVSARRISRLSWDLLGLLDVDSISAARRRNFAILGRLLPDVALLEASVPTFVPLGFPVRVAAGRRDAVRAELFRQRVFPAVHWERLLAPEADHVAEHQLAATVLTLPCDQRYSAAQMERLAAVFRAAIS